MNRIKLILGASILFVCSNVNAVVIYTDRTSWEEEVLNFNTEQFNTLFVNSQILTFDSGITSFSPGPAANFVNAAFEYNGAVLNPISDSGTELVIEWTFPELIYAFGADFRSIDSDGLKVLGNFDGTGEQSISLASALYSGTDPCVQCISGFFGIVGMADFDSIRWATDNSEETFQIDDFSYSTCSEFPGSGATGGCFPGPGPFPGKVPEPPAILLFSIGLIGLIGFSKRRKAA